MKVFIESIRTKLLKLENNYDPDQLSFDEMSNDNSCDTKHQTFTLTFYEANEAEAILSIRATKKALHNKAVANGDYHIDNFKIEEEIQLVTCELTGRLKKVIESDEF